MIENKINESIRLDFNQLTQILKSIQTVIDDSNECTLLINQDGLSFRGMDASYVSLIDMRLTSNIFEKWNISKEFLICFRPHEFYNIVKTLNKKEMIEIEIDNKSSLEKYHKIIISQSGLKMELELKEPGSNDMPLPKIPLDICLTTSGQKLKEIIKRAASVSDYIKIEVIDNKINFSGSGENNKTYQESKIIDLDNTDFKLKNIQDSISTYSLEFLTEFLKSLQKDSIIDFEFSTTKPARITTKLNNLGIIQFYLAPRIEN